MNKDRLRRVLFDTVAEISYGLESTDKVFEISKMLLDRRDLSFVLYFNHVSYNDPLLAAFVVEQIDPEHRRYLIAPVSMSHLENPMFGLMARVANSAGIETVGIVQDYQVGVGYSQDQANRSYRQWIEAIDRAKRPTGCLISPEGHRSETGVLGQGRGGIVNTGAKLSPVVYIPMGIVYEGEYKRSGFNFGRKVSLILGEETFQEKRNPRVDINELMIKLAKTLPDRMRGGWS